MQSLIPPIFPIKKIDKKLLRNLKSESFKDGKISHIAEDWLYIPKTLEMLTPMLSVITLQLFVYYMGVCTVMMLKGRGI